MRRSSSNPELTAEATAAAIASLGSVPLDSDDSDDDEADEVAEGAEIQRLQGIAANLTSIDTASTTTSTAAAAAVAVEPHSPLTPSTPRTPTGMRSRRLPRPPTPPGAPPLAKVGLAAATRASLTSSSSARSLGQGAIAAGDGACPDDAALDAKTPPPLLPEVSPDLFDYFVLVQPAAALCRSDAGTAGTAGTAAGAAQPGSAEEVALRPVVAARYPSADKRGCPLPEAVGHFCFPRGLTLRAAADAPPPLLHSFCLTDTCGVRLYGCCLVFYDEIAPAELAPLLHGASAAGVSGGAAALPLPPWATATAGATLVAPTSMCLLSRHPFTALQAVALRQLYRTLEAELGERAAQTRALAAAAAAGDGGMAAVLRGSALAAAAALPVLPLERHIVHLFTALPLPPEGGAEVHVTLGDVHLRLARPAPRTVPLLDTARGLAPLFETLSVEHIAELLALLLAEHKVAVCAAALNAPFEVLEALLSLLWPLEWQGAYIPTLPDEWDSILDMPVPFLAGLSSSYFERCPEPAEWVPDVVFVDLDRDVIHRRGIACVALPKHVRQRLDKALAECGAAALYVQPELRHHMPDIDLAFGAMGLAATLGEVGDGAGTTHLSVARAARAGEGALVLPMGPAGLLLPPAGGTDRAAAEQPLLLPLLPCGTLPSRTLSEEQASREPAAREASRRHAARSRAWARQSTEPRTRDAFLQVFLSLLGHYRVYMPVSCGGLAPGLSAGGSAALKSALASGKTDVFEEAEFTKHEKKRRIGGRSSRGRAKQALLSVMVKTQMFEQFIMRRMQAGRELVRASGKEGAELPSYSAAASTAAAPTAAATAAVASSSFSSGPAPSSPPLSMPAASSAEGGGDEDETGGELGFEGHSGAGGALPRDFAAGLDFFDRCAELRTLDEKSRRRSLEASATERRRSSLLSLRSEEGGGGVQTPMPPPPPPVFLTAAPAALPWGLLGGGETAAEADARAAAGATTPGARLLQLQPSQLRASHGDEPGSVPACGAPHGAPNIQWAGALGPADRAGRVASMFQSRPSICAVRAGAAIKRHTPEFVQDKVPHDRAPHVVTMTT